MERSVLGLIGAAIFLVGLSFLDCTQTGLAVALLTIAVSISGCVYSGYLVNHMDIAPHYAGTLMGVANGLSASAGFIAPYIASVITKSVSFSSHFFLAHFNFLIIEHSVREQQWLSGKH